jgi:putative oxidoreductase
MFMQKYEKQIYALLRIIAGFLFLWHGSQKLLGFPPLGMPFPTHILAIAGPIELIGGFLIMIGLFTRYAAFLASGEMAYAYWTVHAKMGYLPMLNRGELAVLYCFVFLYISAAGSGIWSIDNTLKPKRFT